MDDTVYSIDLKTLIDEFCLEVLYAPEGYEQIKITADDVNRPGLQLAGFYDYFDPQRLQLIGRIETTFMERFTPEKRYKRFECLMAKKIPALIITRNIEPFPECLEAAKKHRVPVLRAEESTAYILGALLSSLKVYLAPRITCHGVLVEVYGEGILLLGDSGVGKSETAIELVKRGHRLIADDAVEIRKVSAKTLVGSAPENIRHFAELRGIGVVDVSRLFGMGSIKNTERIDLVINLEQWQDNKVYDRMGLENEQTTILDSPITSLTIPVKPGRNLAVIIEVAAMNNRNKKMGHNSALELAERLEKTFLKR